jgi:hypothetical protein
MGVSAPTNWAEAEANQADFNENYKQLLGWTETVLKGHGLQQRMPFCQRAGRTIKHKDCEMQLSRPPKRTPEDILIYGLSVMDIDSGDNVRVKCEVEDGCPRPVPWGTQPFAVAVDWLQIPPALHPMLAVQRGSETLVPRDTASHVMTSTENAGDWWKENYPYKRHYAIFIHFRPGYARPPKVVCWLQTVDVEKNRGLCIQVRPIDVTPDGVTLRFTTWDKTDLWEITAGWLAYPYGERNDIWTGTYEYRKRKYCSGTKPVAVTFGGEVSFPRPPQVACFLSKLGVSSDSNYRINAHAELVTKRGMVVHEDSWWDTLLWGADVVCIATSSER